MARKSKLFARRTILERGGGYSAAEAAGGGAAEFGRGCFRRNASYFAFTTHPGLTSALPE